MRACHWQKGKESVMTTSAYRRPAWSIWIKVKRCKYLYIMLLIPVIYYVVFHYAPMYGVTIAFKKFNARQGILGSPWVGLKHFEKFLGDEYFCRGFFTR